MSEDHSLSHLTDSDSTRPVPPTIAELKMMETAWNATKIEVSYPFFTFADSLCRQFDCTIGIIGYSEGVRSLTVSVRDRVYSSDDTVSFKLRDDNSLVLYNNNMSGELLTVVTNCLSKEFK